MPSQIPHWNASILSFLHVMMVFFLTYLHDDGAFLLFYPDNSMVKREVTGFFKNYKLKIKNHWTIINCLHLAKPMNPSKNISSNFNLLFFGFNLIVIEFLFLSCILSNLNLILICRLWSLKLYCWFDHLPLPLPNNLKNLWLLLILRFLKLT